MDNVSGIKIKIIIKKERVHRVTSVTAILYAAYTNYVLRYCI